MIKNPDIPSIDGPVLIDAVLLRFQNILSANLEWLNFAFGKCRKLKKSDKKNTIIYPGIYSGDIDDYMSLFPDRHIGNFSFFDMDDPDGVVEIDRFNFDHKVRGGLIFHYSFEDIFPNNHENKTEENVKSLVLQVLKKVRIQNGSFSVLNIVEEAANIYKGYTDQEVQNQFLKRPYGGFRVNLEINYSDINIC